MHTANERGDWWIIVAHSDFLSTLAFRLFDGLVHYWHTLNTL